MLAVGMARDEADIIGATVAHLVNQGARVVLADNLSTDDTGTIAVEAGALVVADTDPAHRQSEKMTALAARFAQPGEWVIPFDADEEWSGLAGLTDNHDIAVARPVVQVPTPDGWREGWQELYPKMGFRWREGAVIDEGNHFVTGAGSRSVEGVLTVKHYQYRSLEQVKRKVRQGAAAMDLAGVPRQYGAHWRDLASMTDDEIAAWWESYCRPSPR